MILLVSPLEKETVNRLGAELSERVFPLPDFGIGHPDRMKSDIVLGHGPTLAAFCETMLDRCPNVRWMHSISAGIETLPFEKLAACGTLVSNSRGIHGVQIAEQAIGMMISYVRRLHIHLRNQLAAKWDNAGQHDTLAGKTLCIVGTGGIGKEIARRAAAFDMRVIGVRRGGAEPMEHFDSVVNDARLDDVLAASDFVVLAAPLTPRTYHMFDRPQFARMKRSAFLVNISRGDLLNEKALIEALQTGDIAGAGLDVFSEEPLPSDSPLWTMDRVLITPHTSGNTKNVEELGLRVFVDNFRAFREGRPLLTPVDLHRRY